MSKKVYCLYTHANVDTFGWPVIEIDVTHVFPSLF